MNISHDGPVAQPKPFPYAPLERLLRAGSAREAAVKLDVSRRQIERYRSIGMLSVHQADTLAMRAGFHPAEVWPDWCEAA